MRFNTILFSAVLCTLPIVTGATEQPDQSTESESSGMSPSGRNAFLYLGVGIDFGGEEIAELTYTDGSSESMDAGEGAHFAVGADIQISEKYLLRGTLGYKTESLNAKNGDVTFTRMPLELTAYRFFGRHGFGGGVTKHNNGEFDCDVSGVCDDSVDVTASTGILLEYLYRSPRLQKSAGYSIGIRAGRGIEYEPSNGVGEDANGNFVGINVGIVL